MVIGSYQRLNLNNRNRSSDLSRHRKDRKNFNELKRLIKSLGLILDETLSWMNAITTKVNKGLNVLKRLK